MKTESETRVKLPQIEGRMVETLLGPRMTLAEPIFHFRTSLQELGNSNRWWQYARWLSLVECERKTQALRSLARRMAK